MRTKEALHSTVGRLFEQTMPTEVFERLRPAGNAVDVVDLAQIEDYPPAFLTNNFTDSEIGYITKPKRPSIRLQRLGARLAAKEAVWKAMGGMDSWDGKEVEVVRGERGKPLVSLSGVTRQRAEELGIEEIHLGLSHVQGYAVAVCSVYRK